MSNLSSDPSQKLSSDQPDGYFADTRRQARHERRLRNHSHPSWAAGAILIVAGILFLGQNLGMVYLRNWWALFILLPSIGFFAAAEKGIRETGRFNYLARASLLAGIILVCFTAIFLFGLDLALYGPVLFILAGLGILVNFVLMK